MRLVLCPTGFIQKGFDEYGNIFLALAQGRYIDGYDVESIKYRSSRKSPSSTLRSKFRLVAAMMRTSARRTWGSPSGWYSCDSRARRSSIWFFMGTSPISSRKRVPPSASAKRPGLSACAPVKAPRLCPNISLANNSSVKPPQLTATKGRWLRLLRSCIARATRSLPTPVSPRSNTGTSDWATCFMSFEAACILSLLRTSLRNGSKRFQAAV